MAPTIDSSHVTWSRKIGTHHSPWTRKGGQQRHYQRFEILFTTHGRYNIIGQPRSYRRNIASRNFDTCANYVPQWRERDTASIYRTLSTTGTQPDTLMKGTKHLSNPTKTLNIYIYISTMTIYCRRKFASFPFYCSVDLCDNVEQYLDCFVSILWSTRWAWKFELLITLKAPIRSNRWPQPVSFPTKSQYAKKRSARYDW